jgi:hypothetical protein
MREPSECRGGLNPRRRRINQAPTTPSLQCLRRIDRTLLKPVETRLERFDGVGNRVGDLGQDIVGIGGAESGLEIGVRKFGASRQYELADLAGADRLVTTDVFEGAGVVAADKLVGRRGPDPSLSGLKSS